MTKWRIYYGDGSTTSSDDSSAAEALGTDVQAIAQQDEVCGREVITKHDYYLYVDGRWIGVDTFGLIDHCLSQGIAKAGRCLPTPQYRQIIEQALHDPDLPRKSAKYAEERI